VTFWARGFLVAFVVASPSVSMGAAADSQTGRCLSPSVAGARAALRFGGRLVGDVDGDGKADVVRLALDPDARPACRLFLVSRDADGIEAMRIRQPSLERTSTRDLQRSALPALVALAAIDHVPGLEVAVKLEEGAATEFLGLFTSRRGRLSRMELRGGRALANVFPYAGSVRHFSGVDCWRRPASGIVASTSAAELDERGAHWLVVRRLFSNAGLRFVLERSTRRDIRGTVQKLNALFPELNPSPFRTCRRT
jgi:hypothetical protein